MKSAFVLLALVFAFQAQAEPTTAPADAKVMFTAPKNGETVPQKFKVKFAVKNLKVEKAGVAKSGAGHHHLIIDGTGEPSGSVVPKDATHMHFGDGQTETEITLPPGKHTLTLQFADGAHMSYGPALSQTITVNVK
jgi:hypothetical protein